MMMTRNEAANWLLERDNFAIVTHRRPDGDTIGTAAALCRILRAQGKTAHVLENPDITPLYAYLLEGLTKEEAEQSDTLVSVDVAAPNMLPKAFEQYLGRIALRIDHHGTATSFTEQELVDPGAGACGEIIYDILMEMWMDLDAATAEALYVAVSTDTGCFRFANTTDHSFLVAAACAAAGASVYKLNQILFDTNSLAKLRLQGWIVEHVKLMNGGKFALAAIPKAVEEELGIEEDDMQNMSSFVRSIEGVCVAATIRETADGAKLSVRAVTGYDAAAVCARFGGGGHKGAAGASVNMSLEEAAAAVEKAMLAEM